ncbi:MAG: hypothetical protein QOF58_3622 [Pseudonocardiales bacterium]|jgi:hypothetical protein|nr:hypothetical protein [Pseudonocardiales bacterium]
MTTIEATAIGAVSIRVFHNNNLPTSMLDGYKSRDTVTEVYLYVEDALDDHVLLGRAFDLFNIGHDPEFGVPDERAVEYRDRGNRSLSVGDVVAIDDRFYTFDRVGRRRLEEQPTIRQRASHGTTPLY